MPKSKSFHKPLLLSVSKPCSENWEAMKETDDGRFCSSCQKKVIDFSGLTDRELYAYFSSFEELSCGRFHHTQLNRNIPLPRVKEKRLPLLYKGIAAILAFLSLKQMSVFSQTQTPTVVQLEGKNAAGDTALQAAVITGTVKSIEGIELEGALVNLNGRPVALTSKDGKFSFEMNAPLKPSVLTFSYSELVTVARSYHPAMGSTFYTIAMDKPLRLQPIVMGMPVRCSLFAPQSFEMPVEMMTDDFRARLGAMAADFRNNPNAQILLVAYGTTQKEVKSAKDLLVAVKTYFVQKEGIGEDRFFTKIKPKQKGKERTFDVEPYDPYLQD